MVEDFKLSDVLRMILETMYRAMAFDRIIFHARRPQRNADRPFWPGRRGGSKGQAFKVPLKAASPTCLPWFAPKGADTMIQTPAKRVSCSACRLVPRPDSCADFLLLPLLQIKAQILGLIYADKLRPGT